jgi:hypothetical protein
LPNIEMRSVIRFLHLKGTSQAEIHRQLVEVYGANVMSRKQVWVWCTAFDNGRTDVQDEQRSGRLSTSITDDNLCRIEGLVQEDRPIRVSDIVDELNISVGTVHNIAHEQLGYRKKCSCWIPRQLTEVHKATRMGLSLVHLTRYREEGVQFLHGNTHRPYLQRNSKQLHQQRSWRPCFGTTRACFLLISSSREIR